MRRTPRFVIVAFPVACLAAALLFQQAHLQTSSVSRSTPATRATIEPTLPLAIDLSVQEGSPLHGEPARLEAVIEAAADLRDVSLLPVFPEGLTGDGGPPGPVWLAALGPGERRVLSVPLRVLGAGDFPIRLEASFRLPDGREFRTQQGILWRRGPGAPEGRHNAGAYEFMAAPVAEPQP